MSDPTATLLGGQSGLVESGNVRRGVHAQFPATQLKYHTDWAKGIESQARMYVALAANEVSPFLANFKDPILRDYVRALAGPGGYIDFILQQANESVSEKVQVVELLADDYVAYFFGQKPSTFSYSGILFTTHQDDWWTAFQYLYNNVLRGSRLADLGRLVSLRYDSRVVTGALLNFSAGLSSDQQMAVRFSFDILVKRVDIVDAMKGPIQRQLPTQLTVPFSQGLDLQVFSQLSAPETTLGTTQIKTTIVDTPRSAVPAPSTTPVKSAAAACDEDLPKEFDVTPTTISTVDTYQSTGTGG